MREKAGSRPNHPIFRADAVRRYQQRREQAVLPRFVSPRTFIYLWAMVGLLVAAGFVAWLARLPVYVSGFAIVVDKSSTPHDVQDDILLVAFLPPENLSRLRVGQSLFLQLAPASERLSRPIIALETEIISPESAQERFALNAPAAQAITQPAAVAIARLEPVPTGLPAATYTGSVYRVDVEVGSRRVLSLVPLIGRLFE